MPTLRGLVLALVRLGVLDTTSPEILDEFAILTECDIYKRYYLREFDWQRVRKALQLEIQQKQDRYPQRFVIEGRTRIYRYDFERKMFPFVGGVPLAGLGRLNLLDARATAPCGEKIFRQFPLSYDVVLEPPLRVPGLQMDAEAGQQLLSVMQQRGNQERALFVQLVVVIDGFARREDNDSVALLGGYIDRVAIYEPGDLQTPIFETQGLPTMTQEELILMLKTPDLPKAATPLVPELQR